jgi:hypothetical protein
MHLPRHGDSIIPYIITLTIKRLDWLSTAYVVYTMPMPMRMLAV